LLTGEKNNNKKINENPTINLKIYKQIFPTKEARFVVIGKINNKKIIIDNFI